MGERAPLLARAVGGKVLGPRPGLAILSFWQGILEIVLRTLALVSCIGLIVPSAMTTIKIDHVNQNDVSYREVISLGKAVCGIVIVGGVMGVALETAAIILRFVNIGFINMKIKYFLFAELMVIAGLIFVFVIGVIGSAVSASQWSHDSKYDIAHSTSAMAAISFFCMVVFIILGAYMLAFIIRKWNKHVVVYTLKDAVLG